MTEYVRLKPWQSLPDAPCRECPARPGRRVTCIDDDDVRHEALACEQHAYEISGSWAAQYGGASSDPLRFTWRYWLETRLYAAWKWVRRSNSASGRVPR